MIDSISVLDLKSKKNVNIIDIRSIQSYNNGHVKNSKNIPLEQLLLNFNKYLQKDEEYYIYCQRGIQSKKICKILKNNGFKVVNIEGGYESYILNE